MWQKKLDIVKISKRMCLDGLIEIKKYLDKIIFVKKTQKRKQHICLIVSLKRVGISMSHMRSQIRSHFSPAFYFSRVPDN